MTHKSRGPEREEERSLGIEIGEQGYTILHTIFHDQLTLDILSHILGNGVEKISASQISEECKVSRSTAFRRLSELDGAGILKYDWKITDGTKPRAFKEYYMPPNVREALEQVLRGLAQVLVSKLKKPL